MEYSTLEYFDMLMLLPVNNFSPHLTARAYARKYPQRRHPNKDVIRRLIQRTRDSGQLVPCKKENGRPRTTRTAEMEEAILQEFTDHPETSSRRVAADLGVDQTTVLRTLREEHLHAYKYTAVQELLPGDYERRVTFCEWLLQQNEEDPQFINCILFSDESMFDKNGSYNMRNEHYWASENPHLVRQRGSQYRWSVNLWGGIVGRYLIGPCVIPDRLTGELYAEFLRDQLPELLEDVPLEMRRRMWFQQDGAAPHYSRVAKDFLNHKFPNSWIGRGGPIAWPARSPDLNPLDFFLWGFLKGLVYTGRNLIQDREELAARLDVAITEITPEMVATVQEDLLRRARACVRMGGAHIEHIYRTLG